MIYVLLIQDLALLCLALFRSELRSRHVLHGPMSLRGGLHGWGLWCGAWAGRGGKGEKLARKNVESLGEKCGKMEAFRLFKGKLDDFCAIYDDVLLRNAVRISSLNVGIAGDFSTQILGLMLIIQLKFRCGDFVVILRQEMRKSCQVWGCVSDYPLVN